MSETKNVERRWRAVARQRVALIAASLVIIGAASSAEARVPPGQDPFYQYSGSTPLADINPGTVLKTRTVPYHVLGFPLPIKTTQLLYRSTGQLGQPTVNVTSVIQPAFRIGPQKLISYQSVYDSLNPDDESSYAISGGLTLGGLIPDIETVLLAPFLLQGYSIVISDTEGQQADFLAGREYGMNVLNSLRATFNSPAVGLPGDTKVVLVGYSGGAIASEWAAELAPSYAPDVDRHIIGSSIGGVFVDPARNLRYINGSLVWAGLTPMALVGMSRAFNVDLTPYLNEHGKAVFEQLQKASILNVLAQYPGLTWASIAGPEYQTPEKIPAYVKMMNDLIMGTGGTPSAPMLIQEGTGGDLVGTSGNQPGFGAGDGVMIAGDVRTLARDYCSRGVKVQYGETPLLSHTPDALLAWIPETLLWVNARFANLTPPQNCGQIPAGNSLAPIPAL
ncbi:triacylglycerol lipase [Paraburkholderia acidicola]|uniref:Triacylglycerol lipase n=1 Tax=Paraburkholderia acidicola TaxID=1912599 RepID=A0A2A4F0Z1_9BURK|nr:lipase family protein [Paraburkholderia acidicola]PCE27051.1 triacylglycerol lipase [Paraburkholderia acidicola]